MAAKLRAQKKKVKFHRRAPWQFTVHKTQPKLLQTLQTCHTIAQFAKSQISSLNKVQIFHIPDSKISRFATSKRVGYLNSAIDTFLKAIVASSNSINIFETFDLLCSIIFQSQEARDDKGIFS